MADGNAPRRPTKPVAAASDDYEVVDDAPRPPVRARPVAAKPLPAKPAPAKPNPARPAADTRVGRASTTETPKLPAKPKVVAVAVAADDDEVDDRPRPKKKASRLSKADKQRIKAEAAAERAKERAEEARDWIAPGIMGGVGAFVTLVSAAIHGSESVFAAVGVAVMLVASVIYVMVQVPVTLVMLIAIGKVFGIEYGSFKHCVRSLGALTVLLIGIYWGFSTIFPYFLGLFLAPPVASIVTFVVFMTLFRLDMDETRVTTVAINFLTFVGNQILNLLTIIIIGAVAGGIRNANTGGGGAGDNEPAAVAPEDPGGDAGDE